MTPLSKLFNKTYLIVFVGVIVFEALSFLGFIYGPLNTVLFFILTALVLIIGLAKPEWGIYIVLAELFIGSKGYLFNFEIAGFSISIRLAMFLAIFLAFLVKIIWQRKINFLKTKLARYFGVFLVFLVVAVVIGIIKNNDFKTIFLDANGYLYFGLILPIFQFIDNREKLHKIFSVLLASVSAVIIKTIFLLFIFSHNLVEIIKPIYRWVRVTGVGEISTLDNGLARIFIQSHIFQILAFFILISLLVLGYKKITKKSAILAFFMLALISSTIIISYSRSFWLAWLAGIFLFLAALLFINKIGIKKTFISAVLIVLAIGLGLGFELGIINFPYPGKGTGVSASSLITERTTDLSSEAAAQSRFELLGPLWQKTSDNFILGAGLGATVTYQTKDPRYIEMHGDSNYTAYAFEWGYLDLWLKLGILGLLSILAFVFKIFKDGLVAFKKNQASEDQHLILALLIMLLVTIAIHATTPYLNHPLGIGILLIAAVAFNIFTKEKYAEQ